MKAWRPRTLVWLLAVVLVVLTGAAAAYRLPPGLFGWRQPERASPGLQGVECLGRIDVDGGVLDLAPVRPGRVVAIPVHEGDVVAAGVTLLQLDEQPARLQIQTARAAQEAAQAQVVLAEEAVRLHPSRVAGQQALARAASNRVSASREELRRKQLQFAKGLGGFREEITAAQDEVKALEAVAEAEDKRLEALRAENPELRVQQARAEVARARALLAEAEYGLEQLVVKAPAPGRVLRVRCGAGEVVSPERAVIIFEPTRPYLVRAEVEQELIHLVEVGQAAVVRDEMNPSWSWKGRVTRVGDWYSDNPSIPRRMARFTDIPTVECLIALDPGHPPVRLGQRMTVFLGKAAANRP
jgi:HlyD family secretion protein